jgi:hypothetical protein
VRFLLCLGALSAVWLADAVLARAQFGDEKDAKSAKAAKAAPEKDKAKPKTKERAKEKDAPLTGGVKFGRQATQRWRVGVKIEAAGGPCFSAFATAAVPTDWPEQTVKIVNEELSSHVGRVTYRVLENGVKQMLVEIPQIPAGETAQALVTFEVTRSAILPPDDPSVFKIPDRLPRDISKFLGPSPNIETRDMQIQKLAKEVAADKEGAWEKVETIYDWVRTNVEYKDGPVKGARAALRDKSGYFEDLTALFIALCRDNKIPARTVWIPDSAYPEFYLVDDKGQGHWIPCQVAGTRDFGGIPEFRPVLQKGDNFKVPETKEPQPLVGEFLRVKGGNPKCKFVRDLLPGN